MGIGADSSLKAFAQADVTALFARKPITIHRDFYEQYDRENTNHIILAVDPAGGGASAFAISSIVQLPTGQIVVRCSPCSPLSAACSLGQLPSRSPAHISASTTQTKTKAPGL